MEQSIIVQNVHLRHGQTGLFGKAFVHTRIERFSPFYRKLSFAPGDFSAVKAYYMRAILRPMFPTVTDAKGEWAVATLAGMIG